MGGILNSDSLANGLSAAGTAMGQFFGTAGLEQQKSDLENQRLQIANQLQTEREHTGRVESEQLAEQGAGVQHGFRSQEIGQEQAGAQNLASLQATLAQQTHGVELSQDTKAAVDKLTQLSTPDMLAATKAIALANTVHASQIMFGADGTVKAVDPITNKAVDMMDSDGNPLKLRDPGTQQAVTEGFKALTSERNALDSQRAQEMTAANNNLNAVKSRPDLIGPAKDKAIADAQAGVQQIIRRYDAKLSSLDVQSNALLSAIGSKTGTPTPTLPVTPSQGAPLAMPKVGDLDPSGKYQFQGGDPNQASSWKPAGDQVPSPPAGGQ